MLRSLRTWIGFAVSALALWLTLRSVDFVALGRALAGAKGSWFLPAAACFLLVLGLRTWRWSLLMGGSPAGATFHAMNIGYLMNIVLPLRLGEVGRAVVMGARGGVPAAAALSSIVVERVLDLAAVVALFASFAARAPLPPSFARAAAAGAALALLVIAACGLLLWQAVRAERLLAALLGRLMRDPAPWLARFRELCSGFRAVGSPARLALVLALTALLWAGTVAVTLCFLGAFLPPSLPQAGLATATANLGGAVPSAPGGLGIVQGFASAALVVPFHLREEDALAFVFTWTLGQQLALILLGLFGLARIGMSLGELRRNL